MTTGKLTDLNKRIEEEGLETLSFETFLHILQRADGVVVDGQPCKSYEITDTPLECSLTVKKGREFLSITPTTLLGITPEGLVRIANKAGGICCLVFVYAAGTPVYFSGMQRRVAGNVAVYGTDSYAVPRVPELDLADLVSILNKSDAVMVNGEVCENWYRATGVAPAVVVVVTSGELHLHLKQDCIVGKTKQGDVIIRPGEKVLTLVPLYAKWSLPKDFSEQPPETIEETRHSTTQYIMYWHADTEAIGDNYGQEEVVEGSTGLLEFDSLASLVRSAERLSSRHPDVCMTAFKVAATVHFNPVTKPVTLEPVIIPVYTKVPDGE